MEFSDVPTTELGSQFEIEGPSLKASILLHPSLLFMSQFCALSLFVSDLFREQGNHWLQLCVHQHSHQVRLGAPDTKFTQIALIILNMPQNKIKLVTLGKSLVGIQGRGG